MQSVSRFTVHASRLTTDYLRRLDLGLVIAALLTLLIIHSLLRPGLPTAADYAIHLYRTMEYKQAWVPGVIVPRWAPNLAFGYGYPLFVFAPPLPYLLGVLFHLMGVTLESALKAVVILTILLYAVGMYLLARDLLRSVAAGLVAAVAYAFAPFALREALLYGGNIPQFLAIGLFPWPLWAALRAARSGRWGWSVLAAACYAAIILSHLFHALVFTPVLGLFILLLIKTCYGKLDTFPPFHPSTLPIFHLLLIIPLGLLLSAFSWLPAFIERFETRAQADVYIEKSPFFIRYPHWSELIAWIEPLDARAANPYVPLSLGPVTLLLATLGLLIGLWLILRPSSFVRRHLSVVSGYGQTTTNYSPSPTPQSPTPLISNPHSPTSSSPTLPISHSPIPQSPLPTLPIPLLFFALTAATGALMSLPLSRPLWEMVSILQVAEFPWRMLGLANLGLAVLAGAALLWLPSKSRAWLTIPLILLQIWAVGPLLYPVTPFAQYGQVSIADQIDYERRSQSVGTTTLGEYLPRTVPRVPTTSPLVEAFMAGAYPARLDETSLPAGARATLLKQNAITYQYRLETPTPFSLRLHHYNYPGWRAWLDDQPLPIRADPDTGLMRLDIPAGEHTLLVRFGETPLRLLSLALSGVAVAGIVGVWLWLKRRDAEAQGAKGEAGILSSAPKTASDLSNRQGSGTASRVDRGQRGRIEGCGEGRMLLSSAAYRKGQAQPGGSENFAAPPLRRAFALLLLIVIALTAAFVIKPLLRPLFTIRSPAEQIIPATERVDVPFELGIRLVGYQLEREVVDPGDYLPVVLYWETDEAPLPVNLQPFVHLDRLDTGTTLAGSTNYTPGDVTTESNMPTFHWDTARYVRDEHDLTVPLEAPPHAYALRAGLIDPDRDGQRLPLADGSGDTVTLAIINIRPAAPPEPLAEPVAVTFRHQADQLQLTGFEVDNVTTSSLDFTLAWRTDQPLPRDYTIFAQLLDMNHNLVIGFDRPPLDGAYPTSTWLSGQTILDRRTIPLDGVAPGAYRLIVGLYDSATQQRLVTPSGADFVQLTTVTIE